LNSLEFPELHFKSSASRKLNPKYISSIHMAF